MDKHALTQLISEVLPKDLHGESVVEHGVGNFPVFANPEVLAERIAEHILAHQSDSVTV